MQFVDSFSFYHRKFSLVVRTVGNADRRKSTKHLVKCSRAG